MITAPTLADLITDAPGGLYRTRKNAAATIRIITALIQAHETIELTESGLTIDQNNYADICNGIKLMADAETALILKRRKDGVLRASKLGRMGRYKFTAEDVDVMIGKLLAGQSRASIAREMGCTVITISAYARRYRDVKAMRKLLAD